MKAQKCKTLGTMDLAYEVVSLVWFNYTSSNVVH